MTAGGRIRILADDLTGSADSGVAFARGGVRVVLTLDPGRAGARTDRVTVIDTDTREASSAVSYAAIRTLALQIDRHDHVLKKIDSLLRGQIASELAALRAVHPERLVIVAPAVPAVGRLTKGGAVLLGGPGRWQPGRADAPQAASPAQVADQLGDGPVRAIGLDAVRSGTHGLTSLLGAGAVAGAMAVCDAVAEDDLDRIVRAGLSLRRPVLWVGAAGLAAALARALLAGRAPDAPAGTPRTASPLVIIGSPSPVAHEQVHALVSQGAQWIGLEAGELLTMSPEERGRQGAAISGRARGIPTVVSIIGDLHLAARPAIAAALGEVCAPAVADAEVAVMAGGATARAVLTGAGVTSLRLLGELQPGVILTRAAGVHRQLHVITKSGSFGDRTTLVRLAAAATQPKGIS